MDLCGSSVLWSQVSLQLTKTAGLLVRGFMSPEPASFGQMLLSNPAYLKYETGNCDVVSGKPSKALCLK